MPSFARSVRATSGVRVRPLRRTRLRGRPIRRISSKATWTQSSSRPCVRSLAIGMRRLRSCRKTSAAISRGSPVVAREPSLAVVVAHLARRYRATFIAVGVSTVAILAALGVSIWQTQVARAERRRAEQRFADARQLANSVIFDIHDEVLKLEGSTPVRQKIVAEALGVSRAAQPGSGGDAAFKIELARAYYRIGSVQGSPASWRTSAIAKAPARSFAKAIELLHTARCGGRRRHIRRRTGWATSSSRGRALAQSMGARDEQRQAVALATQIAETLVSRNADDVRARRLIANAYFQQALLLPAADRVAAWQRAGGAYQHFLGSVSRRSHRAAQCRAGREVPLGGRTRRSAISHRRSCISAGRSSWTSGGWPPIPPSPIVQGDVAIDLGSIAHTLRGRLGSWPRRRSRYERSVAMRQRLAVQDPEDVLSRSRLAFAVTRLARVYSDLGRHAEAMRAAEEVRPQRDASHRRSELRGRASLERESARPGPTRRRPHECGLRVIQDGGERRPEHSGVEDRQPTRLRLEDVMRQIDHHAATCGYEAPRRD